MAENPPTGDMAENPPTGDKGNEKDNKKTKSLAPYLKGLTFRTNKAIEMKDDDGKPVMVNGKPRMTYIPVERDLKEEDVLNAYESGGEMVIVTKDGRKYRVRSSKS